MGQFITGVLTSTDHNSNLTHISDTIRLQTLTGPQADTVAGLIPVETLGCAASTLTLGTPIVPTRGGKLTAGVGEDWWFERIHIIPNSLVLGNVLAQQTELVYVFNAHRDDSKTLSVINEVGTDGIVITEPSAPPLAYPPLTGAQYEFTIEDEGPAIINATVTFDFTGTNDPVLTITGSRVVLFAHCPQHPITEIFSFSTDVIEAYDGTEQRIETRDIARLSIQMEYLMNNEQEISSALHSLIGQAGRIFSVPMWQYVRNLTADLAGGELVIPLDTSEADFRDDSIALLWKDFNDFEVIEVDTVTVGSSGQLNLTRAVDNAHDAIDTLVLPLHFCYAKDPVQHNRTRNGVTRLTPTWLSTEPRDLSGPDTLYLIYRNAIVVDDPNIVDSTLSESIRAKPTIIDNGTGIFEVLNRRIVPALGTRKTWEISEDRNDSFNIMRLIQALRGKQRAFWLPTFKNDFQLVSPIGSTDTTIEVENVDYLRFIDSQEPLGDIAIFRQNGSMILREILSTAPGVGGTEVLTLDSQVGSTLGLADVLRISYLHRVRLDSDRIEIKHERQGSIKAGVPVVGVIA